MKRMQTPAARVRHLGSARNGTGHFILQRLTALALVPLAVAIVGIILKFVNVPYDQARALFISPWVAGPLALFLLVAAVHMKIGMQVIIEDYVHHEGLRFFMLIGNIFLCAALAFAGLFALLRLSVGL